LLASHLVYGLQILSDLTLPGLLLRPNSDLYDVRIRLKGSNTFPSTSPDSVDFFYPTLEEPPDSQPNLRVGVLRGSDYFCLCYSDGVRFAVERRGREVWADWPENYTLEDVCTYLLGPVLGFVLRLRGVTCLHASAVAVEEQAIALMGFPGAGKSTTAAAFAQRGFSVIADDVVPLTEEGENFLVPPGYPRVNLWPDAVSALFGSMEALPLITPTWDKRYTPLGNNGLGFVTKALPLRAIYVLCARESALSAPVIEEITGGDALTELVANTYVNYLLNREMRSREFDVLSRVVATIPIRLVRPPDDPAAIFELCDAIVADAKRVPALFPFNETPRHD
jgi:hypothetical protein